MFRGRSTAFCHFGIASAAGVMRRDFGTACCWPHSTVLATFQFIKVRVMVAYFVREEKTERNVSLTAPFPRTGSSTPSWGLGLAKAPSLKLQGLSLNRLFLFCSDLSPSVNGSRFLAKQVRSTIESSETPWQSGKHLSFQPGTAFVSPRFHQGPRNGFVSPIPERRRRACSHHEYCNP